jgi:molecular chaperone DnaK
MYAKQAEADQAGAADASEQGSGANDDAVDAEFEEVKDDK